MSHENSLEPCHAPLPVVAGEFPSDMSLGHPDSVQEGSRSASGSPGVESRRVGPPNRTNLRSIYASAPSSSKPESAELLEEPADWLEEPADEHEVIP